MTAPRVVGVLVATYGVARTLLSFLEALSVVRAERADDLALLAVCASDAAKGSLKLRAACLAARADVAAPVVVKALVRAVSTAFADFCSVVSSPGRLLMLLFFLAASVLLPVRSWLAVLQQLCGHRVVVQDDDDESALHLLEFVDMTARTHRLRGAFQRALRLRKRATSPPARDVEPGVAHFPLRLTEVKRRASWEDIDLTSKPTK